MNLNEKKLIDEFHRIANEGWISSACSSWGSIGLTFEKELGKNPDSNYNPDFMGIEIKCVGRYSRYPLFLFTIAFDGPSDDEISRLTLKYGYPDSEFEDKNVLYEKVNSSAPSRNGYYYKLFVEYDNKRIVLGVFDVNYILLEKISFITFDSLKKHLLQKLQNLAVVYASTRNVEKKYFRYYKMNLFSLKSFAVFLNLVQNGTVGTQIISRISKSGPDKGRYRNKNIVFTIPKYKIRDLFVCKYSYDYDKMFK